LFLMRLNRVRTSHLHASRAWVSTWGLVLTLLWAQSLGLWHGIVHGGHGVGSVHASLAIADAGEAKSHGFFESLFGDHENFDCQLFDQLSHGDALVTAPLLALPLGVPAAHIARLAGLAVARWAALFQARAPPFSR
jgi:hypothetical protein